MECAANAAPAPHLLPCNPTMPPSRLTLSLSLYPPFFVISFPPLPLVMGISYSFTLGVPQSLSLFTSVTFTCTVRQTTPRACVHPHLHGSLGQEHPVPLPAFCPDFLFPIIPTSPVLPAASQGQHWVGYFVSGSLLFPFPLSRSPPHLQVATVALKLDSPRLPSLISMTFVIFRLIFLKLCFYGVIIILMVQCSLQGNTVLS